MSHSPTGTVRPTRTGPRRRRILLATVVPAGLIVVIAALAGLWVRQAIHASLPPLEGEIVIEGLTAPVTIERDRLGVPTIRASSRMDLAFATGFVQGQDRFFQMDLLRRSAAGELSELIGRATVEADRRVRVHRFRSRAEEFLRRGSPENLGLVRTFARGINEGLASLEAKPLEYLLLRSEPEPWRPEDSTLVLLAMFLDLQDERGVGETRRGLMRDLLPSTLFEFLTPVGTEWDAPLVGGPYPAPPVPGPGDVDIRSMEAWAGLRSEVEARAALTAPGPILGSNNWAVAGSRTAHGSALLAGDMHLRLGLPNIWYRASFVWPDEVSGKEHRVTGVTLPGGPVLVAGSNTHIAWAYTNSYGDWSDVVIVETDPGDPGRYLTPDGPREFERHEETIRIKGGEKMTIEVVSTIWGPLIGEDHRSRPVAIRWVAHDPEAVNFGQLAVEKARDVDEAIELANRTGIPAQNFVVADAGGRIGWTIMGAIPRRFGFSGWLPESWADGSRGWGGWLAPSEYPRLVDPEEGLLWTANARTVEGEMLRKIGNSGYPLGARAAQIRDGLRTLDVAGERDMLRTQLDDRALFLERWRTLLLDLLKPEALEDRSGRVELRRLVEQTWTGRASIDSAGYRLVRAYRVFLSEIVFDALTSPCKEVDPGFVYSHRQREGPLWQLVTERPPHLLHPKFENWEEWLLHAVDYTLDYYLIGPEGAGEGSVRRPASELAGKTWGDRNRTRVGHPLAAGIPALSRWLDAPPLQLPGDANMPRVQSPVAGASQRMVVSPGREEQGIFHMPGGQSGHPLSPHYLDGHEAWADGEATPFLPGPTVHTMTLKPGS